MRYAMTDIHGCSQTMLKALDEVDFSLNDELFLLGDYIDRGPDSMGVIQAIWDLQDKGHKVVCLRGNHEQMVLDFEDNKRHLYEWYPPKKQEAKVLNWMRNLPYYHITPGYILVHAGLNFRHIEPLDDTQSMMWIRYWYDEMDRAWLGNRIIVHGHTPEAVKHVRFGVKHVAKTQRLCIDSGCVLPSTGMGYLTMLNLDTKEAIYVKRVD